MALRNTNQRKGTSRSSGRKSSKGRASTKTAAAKRISSVLKRLPSGSAMLVASAPLREQSRDTNFAHHQDADFYFLTESERQDTALLLSEGKAYLMARPQSELEKLWEGPQDSLSKIARAIGADALDCSDLKAEVLKKLRGKKRLYIAGAPDSLPTEVAKNILSLGRGKRGAFPSSICSADEVLTEFKELKSSNEVKAIEAAIELSWRALLESLESLKSGVTERRFAAVLNGNIVGAGAGPSFEAIVAAGGNAAVLHHSPSNTKFKPSDLVLIDYGAELEHYCADITRCFPVSGKFSAAQARAYDLVHEALEDSIRAIKPGKKLQQIQSACEKSISKGLIRERVLKGTLASVQSKKAFRKYFPHGVSHGLGLDTHDPLSAGRDTVLKPGMVITVEPGIYSQSKFFGAAGGLGIRLEQDVLVTRNGSRVLSKQIPLERDEIERLLKS